MFINLFCASICSVYVYQSALFLSVGLPLSVLHLMLQYSKQYRRSIQLKQFLGIVFTTFTLYQIIIYDHSSDR